MVTIKNTSKAILILIKVHFKTVKTFKYGTLRRQDSLHSLKGQSAKFKDSKQAHIHKGYSAK